MNLLLDSDVLTYALHLPRDKLLTLHKKSNKIFESVIRNVNSLYITSTIFIEALSTLAKLGGRVLARDAYRDITDNVAEVFPIDVNLIRLTLSIPDMIFYLSKCIKNAIETSKIKKDSKDSKVPGWKDELTEVSLSGMDIFILSYAQLRNLVLITNDWSLWYVAWKSRVESYWLTGLNDKQIEEICNGKGIIYP